MAQNILSEGRLLDENGNLAESGYALDLVKTYSRGDIKGCKSRIKEWDYFYIGDNDYGVAVTVADNSYMTLVSASVMDFSAKEFTTASDIKLLTKKRIALPAASFGGNISYSSARADFSLTDEGDHWRLVCRMRCFNKVKDTFECDYKIAKYSGDSMVIATPFSKKRHFYYNQKINCLDFDGSFSVGNVKREHHALGVLDWGRGVWTYRNTWYWASLSCLSEGVPMGFNLGYGFGDTSAATENMFFYDGKAHKLNNVVFNIPRKGSKFEYMKTWTFNDDEGRMKLNFEPIVDRFDDTNAVIIRSCQHQVFGAFSGYFITDDGEKIEFKDKVGFAERVYNKW